ncbi:MAG TPA: undecaprenyl-diphosphate phosphatase [Candidatus Eisenbacteria bacterium]|jgi:undecaprenyl-diphosphatase
MSPVQAAVLGAIQGLTEFLPISSSAHLYVVPTLLGWKYAGLAFDVALHWGTLLALLAAYGDVWIKLARDAFSAEPAPRAAAWTTLAKLAAASVPGAVAGVALEKLASGALRGLPLQAAMLAIFGFVLWAVDRFRPAGRDVEVPDWGTCMAMGFSQALALVPGVSRSGITITAGRAAGLSRVSAARFSFLLATPITFGAGLLELRHLGHGLPLSTLAIGVVSAAVVGFLAIRGLIRYLGRAGFGVFFAYRVLLAAVIAWRVLAA